MAKVSGPLHSTNAVGRFAGSHIYNNWRGVQYCKQLTAPANSPTPRRLRMRGILSQLAQAWQGLTDAQRVDWQVWADANQPLDPQFGRNTPWSGFNAYCALNSRLLDLDQSTIADPPVAVAPDPVLDFAAAFAAGDITLTWTATAGTNLSCDVWYYRNPSPARNPNIQAHKHHSYTSGEDGTATIASAEAGTWYFLARVVSEDDGQVSTYVSAKVTAT
jgi:hypothetical protein